MHLELFLTTGKVSIPELYIVLFIGYLAKQINAVELMENFKPNSVTLDSSLWVDSLEMIRWHSDDLSLGICDNLISN